MDVINEKSSMEGNEIDKKVEIAKTIQALVPITPPRPIPEPGSLAAWVETPSPVTPKEIIEYSQSKKRILSQINPRLNSTVKSFNGSSTSVFGERSTTSKNNKAPVSQARKIEAEHLNESLRKVGVRLNSITKGEIIRKMQKEKLLNNKFPKKVDPFDGKEKNIYSPKEFLSILNYLIKETKSKGNQYFNCNVLQNSEELVIQENCFYCDDSEEIFYQKLAQFKINHHLSD